MKEQIDWRCYSTFITKSIRKGILITSSYENKVNSMTIGWGTLGFCYSRPIFIAFIRKTRFTKDLILKSKEFTVNIPLNEQKEITNFLGTKSGRDIDKIKSMNLTLVPGSKVLAPAIKEFPLTLECKVLYYSLQDLSKLPNDIKEKYYPDVSDERKIFNKEAHYAIYGEIVDSYIIK